MTDWLILDWLEDFRLYCLSFWSEFYLLQSELGSPGKWTSGVASGVSKFWSWSGHQSVGVRIALWFTILVSTFWVLFRSWYKLTTGVCRSKARLDGKTVLVTGANMGIGLETARDLASRGARVILGCRNMQKGKEACQEIADTTGNSNLVVRKLDLSCLKTVRQFACEILETEIRLDVLVLNAGIAVTQKFMTEDGLELHMASNHFGHFLLTNLLGPLMVKSAKGGKAPGRIVVVSSLAHKWGRIELDNLNGERYYDKNYIYGNTKLANILFTKELARRLRTHNVIANCLHPGAVQTGLFRHLAGVGPIIHFVVGFWFKSAKEGAQTSIYLSVDEDVMRTSGEYFSDCRIAKTTKAAQDKKLALDLWNKSVEILQMAPEEELA